MSINNHTPTPWTVVDNGQFLEINVPSKLLPTQVDKYSPSVVSTILYQGAGRFDGRANAAFIVRACNAHDQLVKALRDIATDARRTADAGDAEGSFVALGDIERAALAALVAAGAQP